MPEAYSLDLRERVARFVEGGRSCHAAAALFSESVSFVVRLMKSLRATGGLAPKPSGGRRHAKLDPHRAFLLARIAEKADMTMPELSAELDFEQAFESRMTNTLARRIVRSTRGGFS